MKRLMVDIETLSTANDAAVLSVGVAVFNDTQILDTNGWAIDLKQMTGEVDFGTLQWWMKQDEQAREFSFKGTHAPLFVAQQLNPYLVNAEEVWANDPDFDLVILESWWQRTNQQGRFPVSHRKHRSVRTIKMLGERYYVDTSDAWTGLTAHNPIEDSVGQARLVMKILNKIDGRFSELQR